MNLVAQKKWLEVGKQIFKRKWKKAEKKVFKIIGKRKKKKKEQHSTTKVAVFIETYIL